MRACHLAVGIWTWCWLCFFCCVLLAFRPALHHLRTTSYVGPCTYIWRYLRFALSLQLLERILVCPTITICQSHASHRVFCEDWQLLIGDDCNGSVKLYTLAGAIYINPAMGASTLVEERREYTAMCSCFFVSEERSHARFVCMLLKQNDKCGKR